MKYSYLLFLSLFAFTLTSCFKAIEEPGPSGQGVYLDFSKSNVCDIISSSPEYRFHNQNETRVKADFEQKLKSKLRAKNVEIATSEARSRNGFTISQLEVNDMNIQMDAGWGPGAPSGNTTIQCSTVTCLGQMEGSSIGNNVEYSYTWEDNSYYQVQPNSCWLLVVEPMSIDMILDQLADQIADQIAFKSN